VELANDTPAINFCDVNLGGYRNKTTGACLTRENELHAHLITGETASG
jgi:hypothetical protein